MTPAEFHDCLLLARSAAEEAGRIALEYFRRPVDVTDKRTGHLYDPVTEADRRIEQCIRERIAARYPGHRIIGEEFGETGIGDVRWWIDPIDGTRAFISGMPAWGVLIGLQIGERCAGGLMHQPFTGETFVGDPEGARLYHAGREIILHTRASAALDDAVLYSTHPSMFSEPEMARRYERLASNCRLQRWGGDCYSFCLLAMGCVDLVVESMLMPYDIIPLIPIIEGAGGVVRDLEDSPASGGGTVIAAANEKLYEAARAIMTASKS